MTTPPPSSSPLVEKVSRARAAADGYVSLSRAGNAYYDSLALAAVRVVVEAAAEECRSVATFWDADDLPVLEDAVACILNLLPSEPEA